MNTFVPRESEDVPQFYQDHILGAVNNVSADMDVINIRLREFIDSKRRSFEPDGIVITSSMTLNGGTISFYHLDTLENQSDKDEERSYFNAVLLGHVLIEPLKYPETEPYNRQPPYYIGCRYSQLDKVATDKFSVYTSTLNTGKSLCILTPTSFSEFYYNDFWKSIQFSLAIDKNDIIEFVTVFLNMMNFDKRVLDIVTTYAERLSVLVSKKINRVFDGGNLTPISDRHD